MKNRNSTHWFRTTVLVLVLCGLIGLILGSVLYFHVDPSASTASASIEFSFDGAAGGYGPNGVPLSIDGLTSDAVLKKALADTSLEQNYSPEVLRTSLTVTGVYPEDLIRQVTSFESLMDFAGNRELTVNVFHPTLYRVSLSNSFDPAISRVQLESLLKSVLENFRDYFIERYSYTVNSTANLGADLSTYDYSQLLDILEESILHQAAYAQEMYEKEPLYQIGGKGFNDVYVQLNSLVESDIARLNSNITINALTRDTERLITQYQFEIRDLTNQLNRQRERLKKLDELISSYDKNEIIYLSTADSLTKIDGNSSETYDALVSERKDVSDGITEINSRITTYQLKLSDLIPDAAPAVSSPQPVAVEENTLPSDDEPALPAEEPVAKDVELSDQEIEEAVAAAEKATAIQKEALENSFNALIEKQQAVVNEFQELLSAYNEEELNEMTVSIFGLKYDSPKVLSGSFVKQIIKTAGPFCAVGFMICMVLLIRSRKKESV